MRRLLLAAVICVASVAALRTGELPGLVLQIVGLQYVDIYPYTDVILLGAYTLLIMLFAPAIKPQVDASEIKVEAPKAKVSIDMLDIDVDALIKLVNKMNIGDPHKQLPELRAKLATVKSAFETISELNDDYDFAGIAKTADQIREAVKALSILDGLDVPNVNVELKGLASAMGVINEITNDHNLEDMAGYAKDLATVVNNLRMIKLPA